MEPTNPNQTQAALTSSDSSPRVAQLARALDRLPPGTYQLTIVKNEMRAMDWTGVILKVEYEEVERFSVSKTGAYRPE